MKAEIERSPEPIVTLTFTSEEATKLMDFVNPALGLRRYTFNVALYDTLRSVLRP